TNEAGCFARLREGRKTRRYRVRAPHVEPVSVVGAGDVLLAAFIAAHVDGRPPEAALRDAVAAATASTLELGAGRFEPREMGRLHPDVDVSDLEAVTSDR
ncbi:MAG TPA: PfkB family carbohydrate kinase, partial [Gaiellaceae bacterium]|nr:PfkB family carbohydrate kinase [Gaiellaceae bacterium]